MHLSDLTRSIMSSTFDTLSVFVGSMVRRRVYLVIYSATLDGTASSEVLCGFDNLSKVRSVAASPLIRTVLIGTI